MKKLISLLLAFVIAFSLLIIPLNVSAALTGDINLDGKMDIEDLLLLKKHVLKLIILKSEQLDDADVNKDGTTDVEDLLILKKIILKIPPYDIPESEYPNSLRPHNFRRDSLQRVYTNTLNGTETKIPYRLFVPSHPVEKKPFPVIIYLHSTSQRGDDNQKQVSKNILLQNLTSIYYEEFPAIIIAPQCPENAEWTDEHMYSAIMNLIDEITKKYSGDRNRLYIAGDGMGGTGVWSMLDNYPETFAAAIPISGTYSKSSDVLAAKIKNIPVWVFHGSMDKIIKPDFSKKIEAASAKIDGNVWFTEYFSSAHEMSNSVFLDEPNLLPWLFSRNKNNPKPPEFDGLLPGDFKKEALKMEYKANIKGTDMLVPYRLYLPKEEKLMDYKYPIVVFLNGMGTQGDDNEKQIEWNVFMFEQMTSRFYKRYPAIIIAPQSNGFWWHEEEMQQAIINIINEAVEKHRGDRSRVSLVGLSMGGIGTWSLLSAYPDKFAAGVPICGFWWNLFDAEIIKNTPVWIFHSKDDVTVSVEGSREMYDAIKSAGGTPKYTEYKTGGHYSWERAYREPLLLEWMFSQRRDG